jgi:hypothetical protein
MAVVSDLASAQLAARLGLRGQSFPAFTDGNITDAENDADSVDSTFGSRQPPDSRSDALRKKMLQALSDATSALTDLRIADCTMSHIAMLEGTDDGGGTTWLEPVTDEQYAAANQASPAASA